VTDPATQPQAVPSRRRELTLPLLPALAEAQADLDRLGELVAERRAASEAATAAAIAAQAADADERIAAIRQQREPAEPTEPAARRPRRWRLT
jgi:hypothetical protein